jgi:preprotein translocase subunit YajC
VLEATESASGGSGLLTFLPIILLVAAMYFLMIRPQSKRRREAQEMQSRLGPGDEVQTVGGLYGTVVATDDESVTIEAADGVELRYARGAVARILNKAPGAEDEEVGEIEDGGFEDTDLAADDDPDTAPRARDKG